MLTSGLGYPPYTQVNGAENEVHDADQETIYLFSNPNLSNPAWISGAPMNNFQPRPER